MLSFRTNILVLVLASLSLASWRGGTTTTVTAQETTPAGGNVDDSGFGVDTPTDAPVAGVDTPTEAPVAVLGADYCTYSPDPTCYSNNGKPDCCLDDAIEGGNVDDSGFGVDTPTDAPVAGVDTPTEAPVAVLGADYCTYSPDPTCYSNNGKPDCCLDDAIECPAEAAPCDVVDGSETEAPTGGAATTTPPSVAVVGADYCTFAPDPTCYSNSGKPECCLDDAVECPAEAAPCDVVDGSETEAPSAGMVGADYCTFAPDPTCYSNSGKPDCCMDDAVECPADAAPCDVVNADASAPPTPQSTETSVIPTPSVVLSSPAPTGGEATTTPPVVPSPGPTQAPSAGVPLYGSDYCTYSPDPACYSNSGKPECCMNEFIDCPEEKPECDVVGTEVPTKAPIVFAGFQKCSANDVCKDDGLEGNCCPNDDGTVLDCCYGITESPVAAGTDISGSPTSMTSGGTPTGGPSDDADPTTSVPTTEAAVPAVTITTPPPQPETTPTQEQTPEAPEPNDSSGSSSSSNVDINISAAVVVSGGSFVAVAVGVVTTAVVVAVF
eukprot:CAMPEP_0171025498 /NCGR_PEP_ID=MMETSP0736-20130129/33674_1 /TAXON_ID=186038 /ORGANISM="Fragilariopsis kerguelensis, Strain L26-C5" /LENGTH=550 /DNA_ID=CAMNT_0011465757 /DNA_START=249 /DNA_END=1901 /DNA_ORIENTATION=-